MKKSALVVSYAWAIFKHANENLRHIWLKCAI